MGALMHMTSLETLDDVDLDIEVGSFICLYGPSGSGKTTLLEKTLSDLKGNFGFAVLEGDQQTANDADRIAATTAGSSVKSRDNHGAASAITAASAKHCTSTDRMFLARTKPP